MSYFSLCKLPAWRSLSAISTRLTLSRISVNRIISPTVNVTTYSGVRVSSRHIVLGLFTASRPSVINAARRLFANKVTSAAHSIEAEATKATATRDLVIFTFKNDGFYKMLTFFGFIQFFFWGNIGLFFYTVPIGQVLKVSNENSQSGPSTWWATFSVWMDHHRNRIAIACTSLGFLTMMISLIYPVRTVASLSLLKGGNKLGVTTYWHFGQKRQFSVPLESVSCLRSRLAPGVQLPMKIRGRWFYYMLDTRSGQFIEPRIFDHVIGLKRNLK